jgi:ribosomal-protein-alanine N-acetyltransferase
VNEVVSTGERVLLRYPTGSDQGPYLELRRTSDAFLAPWNPAPSLDQDPYAPSVFDELLAHAQTERRHGLFICRRSDQALLGAVNLNEIVRGAFQSAYLGYWIGAAYARQGYMTEALKLAIQFAFDDLGLHRVEANIIPRNTPSMRVVERLGFQREGLSPRYLKIAGVWEDHARWALTIEDWQES